MTILSQQVTPVQITLGQAREKIAAARQAWFGWAIFRDVSERLRARALLEEARILVALAQAEPAQ